MLFTSPVFLFYFLPIILLIYFLAPRKAKNLILLISSIFFYSWGEPRAVMVMISSTIIDFTCGIIIGNGKRKLGLTISIISNISLLAFFKYFNFALENLHLFAKGIGIENSIFESSLEVALPIGISFYTFQTMSYSIDVYRGSVKANRNFIDFATYVTMFPQLIAGPIVRYLDISKQLDKREISFNNLLIGSERFIIGLFKKVLLANTFAAIADSIINEGVINLSTANAWLAIIAYAFQIFFDFSGYSDMAIGLGKIFGFDFLENFNSPYISKSIREFWRRWHISLSTWFRDYVYISLGGNQKGKIRTYINLFIVFFVTGLWHGASWNFVIWGLFHGLFIILERAGLDSKLEKLWSPLQYMYCLLVVLVGWVFFRIETLGGAMTYLNKMFIPTNGDISINSYINFFHFNLKTLFFVILATLTSTPFFSHVKQLFFKHNLSSLYYISLIFLFIISLVYLGAGSYNPFIYFRF